MEGSQRLPNCYRERIVLTENTEIMLELLLVFMNMPYEILGGGKVM